MFESLGFKARNFKCFSDEPVGFDEIRQINVIVGRNNSGKSSMLDIIQHATSEKAAFSEVVQRGGGLPEIIATATLREEEIRKVFNEAMNGGPIQGNHFRFGRKLIGGRISWQLGVPEARRFSAISFPDDVSEKAFSQLGSSSASFLKGLAAAMSNPFSNKTFFRVYAERNIVPESDSETPPQVHDLKFDGDGRGVTRAIQNFINSAFFSKELIERKILEEINSIFGPDSTFRDIACKKLTNGKWEVYLDEDNKGRIPLSESGSGLKTIMMVVCAFLLLPRILKINLGDFIFAFEELENNLHPSILRRLLEYIRRQAEKEKFIVFLTTHSSVTIDAFNADSNAQIIHVVHDGLSASARKVEAYIDNRGILDDLDVRASDLLQSNGIIWVEGPSERIYIKRWIDIWTGGKAKEGIHYQCVFYGGRLLSHLSSGDPDEVRDALSILRVNRNAILVMDSDRRSTRAPINTTKKRIAEEIQRMGSVCIITKGREIENYIPIDAISRWTGIGEDKLPPYKQHDDFFEYIERLPGFDFRKFRRKKVLVAEAIAPYLDRHNLSSALDLSDVLEAVCGRVKAWNKL